MEVETLRRAIDVVERVLFERAVLARLNIITSLLCLFYTIGAFVLYLIETHVHSIDREVLELLNS